MSYEPRRVPWQEEIQIRGLRHRHIITGADPTIGMKMVDMKTAIVKPR